MLLLPHEPDHRGDGAGGTPRHHHAAGTRRRQHGGRRLALHQRPRDRRLHRAGAGGLGECVRRRRPGAHRSTPLLFLPGHPGTSYVDQPPTFDSTANYAATTKMAQKVLAADQLPIKLRQAFTALRSGRPQPVMLELPGDVCAAEVDDGLPYAPVRRMRSAADGGRGAGGRRAPARGRDAADLGRPGRALCGGERRTRRGRRAAGRAGGDDAAGQERDARGASAGGGRGRAVHHRHDRPLSAGERHRARGGHEPDARALHAGDPEGKTILHATADPIDINKEYPAALGMVADARLFLAQLAAELRRRVARAAPSGGPGPPRPSPASSATGAPSTSRSSPTIRRRSTATA